MGLPIPSNVVEALRRLDTCTVSNAIETFEKRLRNEGFADSSVRCLFPQLGTMVGHAVTVRIRSSSPPPDAHPYLDRTDWWNSIQAVPEPRVVVIQDLDREVGLGAFVGEVHAGILRALGCVGAVTNGSARDVPAVQASGFHLFAGSVSVSHAYVHIVDFGTPVEIGGLQVHSGDLLQGDLHGILSVPKDIAAEIPAAAARVVEQDRLVLEYCRSNQFSLEGLREVVKGVF